MLVLVHNVAQFYNVIHFAGLSSNNFLIYEPVCVVCMADILQIGQPRMVAQIPMEIGLFSKVSRTAVGPDLCNVYWYQRTMTAQCTFTVCTRTTLCLLLFFLMQNRYVCVNTWQAGLQQTTCHTLTRTEIQFFRMILAKFCL